jgi:replicative DNA helicase
MMNSNLPHNLEAEQALLGTLMASNDAIAIVAGVVRLEHFSEPVHARIMDAICKAHEAGSTASPLTLKPRFESDTTMAELGGWQYLVHLTANAVPSLSVEGLARQIRELAERRRIIAGCDDLAEAASDTSGETDHRKAAAEHISELSDLLDGSVRRKHAFTLGEAADVVCERLDRMANGEADPNAIPSGISGLDEALGGLRRGAYNILAGRPSMGKTAVGVQVALNVASAGHGVAYFSLEMPATSLTERCIASRLWMPVADSIAYTSISRGDLNDRENRWVMQCRNDLDALPLVIDERPALSASEIEAQARVFASRFQRQGERLGLIVVDHIHKMTAPGFTRPVEVYTHVSARLADLAKRLDCPVLTLAQLNRSVESRDDKRPTLADLRESGAIEQDADAVIFCYRDAYYLERQSCRSVEAEADRMADLAECQNRLELLVAKNRQGPIGTVDCWADMACNVVRDPRDLHGLEARAA